MAEQSPQLVVDRSQSDDLMPYNKNSWTNFLIYSVAINEVLFAVRYAVANPSQIIVSDNVFLSSDNGFYGNAIQQLMVGINSPLMNYLRLLPMHPILQITPQTRDRCLFH